MCADADVALIVDEAHGAHFGVHPELPPSAMQLGADLAVQSTHKVLALQPRYSHRPVVVKMLAVKAAVRDMWT